jgi:hypothetical protein
MVRALTVVMLVGVLSGAASGQALGVLHIRVTLMDAARAPMPIPRHALLISDNPATRTPWSPNSDKGTDPDDSL